MFQTFGVGVIVLLLCSDLDSAWVICLCRSGKLTLWLAGLKVNINSRMTLFAFSAGYCKEVFLCSVSSQCNNYFCFWNGFSFFSFHVFQSLPLNSCYGDHFTIQTICLLKKKKPTFFSTVICQYMDVKCMNTLEVWMDASQFIFSNYFIYNVWTFFLSAF